MARSDPPAASLHQDQPVLRSGNPLEKARAAVILLHGRGGSADDMLGLAEALAAAGLAWLIPQAAGRTWYPQRFHAPLEMNEPWLGSALERVNSLLAECRSAGIGPERVAIGGFSQGACLALEFAARNPRRYGAILAFSGGLIGPPDRPRHDRGDLARTPVFIGCSDADPHIPLGSVRAAAEALRKLGGEVVERIYPGMGHLINGDELGRAREILNRLAAGPAANS